MIHTKDWYCYKIRRVLDTLPGNRWLEVLTIAQGAKLEDLPIETLRLLWNRYHHITMR